MQKTETGTKIGVVLYFDLDKGRFKMELVDIHEGSDYKTFRNLIDSDLIDVAEYNENVDIIVDDEGLMVSGNPVIEIQTKWGKRQLAGKLLFLKREIEDDSVRNVGLSVGEVFALSLELEKKISLFGITD